jgi:hypothetical protein
MIARTDGVNHRAAKGLPVAIGRQVDDAQGQCPAFPRLARPRSLARARRRGAGSHAGRRRHAARPDQPRHSSRLGRSACRVGAPNRRWHTTRPSSVLSETRSRPIRR